MFRHHEPDPLCPEPTIPGLEPLVQVSRFCSLLHHSCMHKYTYALPNSPQIGAGGSEGRPKAPQVEPRALQK